MKKLLISLLFVLSITVNSQSFILTDIGFRDADNPENDYIVFDNLDGDQSTLYTNLLVKINSVYVSPKDVVSAVPDKSISINGIEKESITFNSFNKYDLNYTVTFLFKDGKIRVNAPNLNNISGVFGNITNVKTLNLKGGGNSWASSKSIFNKKGELKEKKQKQELEIFFNGLIDKIISSNADGKSDNW